MSGSCLGGGPSKQTKLLADLRMAVEEELSFPPHNDFVNQALDAVKSRQANAACDGLLKSGLTGQDNRTVTEWMNEFWKLKREEDRHLFLCYYFSRASEHVGKAYEKFRAKQREFGLAVLNIMRYAILPLMLDLNMDVVSVETYCGRNHFGGEMMTALHSPGLLPEDAFDGADFSKATSFALEEKITLGEGSRKRTTVRQTQSTEISTFPPLLPSVVRANIAAVQHLIKEHSLNGNEPIAEGSPITPMMALAVARAFFAKQSGKAAREYVKRADICRNLLEDVGGIPYDDCLPENKGSAAAVSGKVKGGAGCHKPGYGKAHSSSGGHKSTAHGRPDDSWFKHGKGGARPGYGHASRSGAGRARADYQDDEDGEEEYDEDEEADSRSRSDYDEEDEFNPDHDGEGEGGPVSDDIDYSRSVSEEVSESRTAFSGKGKGVGVKGAVSSRTVQTSRTTPDGVVYQQFRQEAGILFVHPSKLPESSGASRSGSKAIAGKGRAPSSSGHVSSSSSSSSTSGPKTAADASGKRLPARPSGTMRPYAGESKRLG